MSVSSYMSTVIMYNYFRFYMFDMVLIYIQCVQGLRQYGFRTADMPYFGGLRYIERLDT
jgi:hypothetical protein